MENGLSISVCKPIDELKYRPLLTKAEERIRKLFLNKFVIAAYKFPCNSCFEARKILNEFIIINWNKTLQYFLDKTSKKWKKSFTKVGTSKDLSSEANIPLTSYFDDTLAYCGTYFLNRIIQTLWGFYIYYNMAFYSTRNEFH